ncbi:similar to Saccharomyces cerevisiae YDL027C Putative protein of unknown function [Maudiozyma barnettii]|uniref:Uncharacterized protein n=1 Tax=Maudiozyma barnettii TaxID=61262 RepID=A0A8H2ZIM4_9SACH|nr:Mrx9p [Kazachstania barnettii]CAB4253194.1 similar to Saccharomyces cerevisiae YDL027C Putative protein of unknown function [Kazachstania barnettii]CAD1780270.1 similar to Saccharomyces cerevisiae YDL027C Putative protein of unknown function [Kazachstania barnettii]
MLGGKMSYITRLNPVSRIISSRLITSPIVYGPVGTHFNRASFSTTTTNFFLQQNLKSQKQENLTIQYNTWNCHSSLSRYIKKGNIYNNIHRSLSRRNIHITKLLKFQNTKNRNSSFFENGRPPPSPIRVFKIPYPAVFLGSFVILTLFFMIIPILFQLLFPIALVGIAVYQFRKWRSNNFYRAIMKKLPNSSIQVSYKTLKSLAYRFFPTNFLKEFDVNTSDADAMMGMIQNRVIEAFNKNEQDIGSHYFPGKDNVKQFNDVLKLDIMKLNTFGSKIDGNFVMSMKYPLMYVEGAQNNHFADVAITFLDDSLKRNQKFETIFELSKTQATCRMVISVQSSSFLFPQQYIISTPGETGHFYGKYKVRTTSDGHREFTIEKDD